MTAQASLPAPLPPAQPPLPPNPPKSRVVAAVLGLVAPGLGQVFVGHTLRGVAWALIPFVGFGAYFAITSEPSPLAMMKTLVGLSLLSWLGGIADVLLMAPRKHRPTSVPAVVMLALAPYVAWPVSAIVLRIFVLEAFKVPSGGMIPSLSVGDHLFADKSVYRKRAPRRGEAFIFDFPEHPDQSFLQRVIAVGGDTLEVRAGHPIINGWEVPSCRVGPYRYTDRYDDATHEGELFVEFLEATAYLVFFDGNPFGAEYQGPFTVKAGETWSLGDNRHNSHDSRMWFGGVGGGVPATHVKGRARLVWLSESGRQGVDLAGDPVAPSPELAAPLAACLARRPSVTTATPPGPK
ncbi:MAG: Signal peptidase [Labilithrix sp.]|nr:Signal peptidase [Labilithrix sp.]